MTDPAERPITRTRSSIMFGWLNILRSMSEPGPAVRAAGSAWRAAAGGFTCGGAPTAAMSDAATRLRPSTPVTMPRAGPPRGAELRAIRDVVLELRDPRAGGGAAARSATLPSTAARQCLDPRIVCHWTGSTTCTDSAPARSETTNRAVGPARFGCCVVAGFSPARVRSGRRSAGAFVGRAAGPSARPERRAPREQRGAGADGAVVLDAAARSPAVALNSCQAPNSISTPPAVIASRAMK